MCFARKELYIRHQQNFHLVPRDQVPSPTIIKNPPTIQPTSMLQPLHITTYGPLHLTGANVGEVNINTFGSGASWASPASGISHTDAPNPEQGSNVGVSSREPLGNRSDADTDTDSRMPFSLESARPAHGPVSGPSEVQSHVGEASGVTSNGRYSADDYNHALLLQGLRSPTSTNHVRSSDVTIPGAFTPSFPNLDFFNMYELTLSENLPGETSEGFYSSMPGLASLLEMPLRDPSVIPSLSQSHMTNPSAEELQTLEEVRSKMQQTIQRLNV